jgi:hypothetical protein
MLYSFYLFVTVPGPIEGSFGNINHLSEVSSLQRDIVILYHLWMVSGEIFPSLIFLWKALEWL